MKDRMKRILIIPRIEELSESLTIAAEYGTGFEFNDFFTPDILDSRQRRDELAQKYLSAKLPEYNTLHGAFFDVIPSDNTQSTFTSTTTI